MAYELIDQLTESKLFPSRSKLRYYNLRDIADLVFIYLLTLELFSKEFVTAHFAKQYAKKTLQFGSFDSFMFSGTDLYVLLHVLIGKNSDPARALLKSDVDAVELSNVMTPDAKLIKKYLTLLRFNQGNDVMVRRMLLMIQEDLSVQIKNYRSIRILVSQWIRISRREKKLIVTRLLQFYRHRAPTSELRDKLELLAKLHRLEIKGANDAEASKGEPGKAQVPWWVKPAAISGGLVAGYALTRKKKDV